MIEQNVLQKMLRERLEARAVLDEEINALQVLLRPEDRREDQTKISTRAHTKRGRVNGVLRHVADYLVEHHEAGDIVTVTDLATAMLTIDSRYDRKRVNGALHNLHNDHNMVRQVVPREDRWEVLEDGLDRWTRR